MVLNGIRKAFGTVSNVITRTPQRKTGYTPEIFPFLLAASQANKVSMVGWSTYYQAMDQEWVSASISAIITEVLGASFDIEHKEEDQTAIDSNKEYLTNLFQFPAGHDSRDTYTRFMWKSWASFLGTGDAFIEVAYNEANNSLPAGFYFIPPHRMQWYASEAQWGYVGSDIRFEDEELIHVSIPDPWNDIWGKSPVDSISRSLTLDILAWKFNQDFFRSGMHPRGTIEYDPKEIGEDVFERTTTELELTMQNNPRGNLFLYGGHYSDIGITNKDMEFSGLTDRVRDRILGVYGVPPQKVSVYEQSTLGADQDSGADKNFWKKRRGEIALFEDAFNNVLGRTGWDEIFEIGEVDLENKLQRAQIEDIRIKNNSLLTNEVRAGYNEDPIESGDTPFSLLVGGGGVPPAVEGGVKTFLKSRGLYYE